MIVPCLARQAGFYRGTSGPSAERGRLEQEVIVQQIGDFRLRFRRQIGSSKPALDGGDLLPLLMKPLPQSSQKPSVEANVPDGIHARGGRRRKRSVLACIPMIFMVFAARVQKANTRLILFIRGPGVPFLGIAFAACPVQVVVDVFERTEVLLDLGRRIERAVMVNLAAAFFQEKPFMEKAVGTAVLEVRAQKLIPIAMVVAGRRDIGCAVEDHSGSVRVRQAL